LDGGAGADTLLGGSGADTVAGGADDDIVFGGNVAGTPLRFEDFKSLRDGAALEDLLNAEGSDPVPLVDDGQADTLNGGAGDDLLILGAGDVADGGEGTDIYAILEDQAEAESLAAIPALQDGETVAIIAEEDGAAPTISIDTDGADAVILADGVALARVSGAAGSLAPADIVLLDPPTLAEIDPT